MEFEKSGETNVITEAINEYVISLINSNSTFWWKDIKISKDNKNVVVIDAKLDVSNNYEMVQLIDSYQSYLLYHDNLVKAIFNKPLSVASLNIVNDDNILKTIETLEKNLLVYRNQILALEDKIVKKIKDFIKEEKIILQDDDFSYKVNKIFNVFKLSKHNNLLEQSLNVTYAENKLKKG